MIVESYSDQYASDVYRLINEFYQESLKEYDVKFEQGVLESTIAEMKAQCTGNGYTGGFLAIIDGKVEGLIAGKEVKTPWSDDRIWHEVVWFMTERYRRYGVKLLKLAREKLKAEGFAAMVMVHMHNSKPDKLARLYDRLGFKPMETNYIGRL